MKKKNVEWGAPEKGTSSGTPEVHSFDMAMTVVELRENKGPKAASAVRGNVSSTVMTESHSPRSGFQVSRRGNCTVRLRALLSWR